jgi:hypothetical protein
MCGRAFPGRPLATEIESKRTDVITAAAIIEIGARLRARAISHCGGLNEANCAVHAALLRLMHCDANLATLSENDLQATLDAISPTRPAHDPSRAPSLTRQRTNGLYTHPRNV